MVLSRRLYVIKERMSCSILSATKHQGIKILCEENIDWNAHSNNVAAVKSAVVPGLIEFFFNSLSQAIISDLLLLNLLLFLVLRNKFLACVVTAVA